ncbi:MAG TPA: hypothetical protein PKV97_00240 [Thauera aminoaromatica]|nr:hypothetical protein [Thauera aminoaromatica]
MNDPTPTESPTSDTSKYEADVQAAIEECRTHLVNKGFDPPSVFVIEALEMTIVAMPPSVEASDRLTRMISKKENADIQGYVTTFAAETVFWVKGQPTPGPAGAIKYLKEVRAKSWLKANLFGVIAEQVQDQMEALRGNAQTKKL